MKKAVRFKSINTSLSGLFESPRKNNSTLIILLHGLTNSMTDCPLINEANKDFLEKGFATFRFDYYGSGKSPGLFKNKTFSILHQNTLDSLQFAQAHLGFNKIGLWGRSLGAILASTICDSRNVFATVLISSTIHTNESFASLFTKDKQYSLPFTGTGKIKGKPVLPYKYYQETGWIDKAQVDHLSKASNVLIIQGTRDKIIPNLDWAKEIYQITLKPKKLVYIKGADHAYHGYEKETITEGTKWFVQHL